MAEIHVVFPKSGPPYVFHHCQAVLEGEFIFWHVESENMAVEQVNIRFEGASPPEFFRFTPHLTEYKKVLQPGPNFRHPKSIKEGLVWGQVPELGNNLVPTKRDEEIARGNRTSKYAVEGLDQNGAVVAVLDPEIITTRPGP